MGKIEGTTKSGFEYSIDERTLNDQRLLDAIVDAESDDASVKIKATKDMYLLFFGLEQYQKLEKHVMDANEGYCPSPAVNAEFIEIMTSAKSAKNS